jgi:putative nucleotidyltransferase with HDIG domain
MTSVTVAPPDRDAARVLVVDDDETIRVALSRFLRSRGYVVTAVGSASDALAALDRDHCDVALCDVRMPGMTGMELLPAALRKNPELAVVMLTAVNDAPTATEALALGASDYLVKPVELVDLQQAVERALHRRALLREQSRVERLVRDEVVLRTTELEHEKSALRDLTVEVAETLINAMEAKSVFLRGHSQRVGELAASIAGELGLDIDTIEAVRLAGSLHDVGKIGTREAVLNKPAALTTDEQDHVRDHVRIGVEILAPLRHLGPVLDYIQDHHEQFDGAGYPRGLAGEAISLGGRILAAADAFDALTSRRAYREPLHPAQAIELLEGAAGARLDPSVFRALRSCVLRRRSLTFIE